MWKSAFHRPDGIASDMNTQAERRPFHRFGFRADCELLPEAGRQRPCELIDLSINGALLALADGAADFGSARGGDFTLKLRGLVNGEHVVIVLGVRAVRVEDRRVACRFVHVDPDSFDRLKALVAENLGDLAMLDRELTQLDYWPGLSVSFA